MVGITYVYIDTIFAFYGYVDLKKPPHPYCLGGCLGILVRTQAVMGVLYACYLLYLNIFSATEQVSHGKAL